MTFDALLRQHLAPCALAVFALAGFTAPIAAAASGSATKTTPNDASAGLATPSEALDIPDVAVVDQDGHARRFFSDLVQGKVVAINFVFTTCTTICNPQGATFAQIERLLGPKVGRDVHLVSVTIDPTTDTPERLKSWSENLGAAPGWTLVTGERDEILRLLKALGAYTPDRGRHTPLLLLGNDRQKRWTRAYSLAPAARIAGLLEGMMSPPGGAPKEGK